MGQQRHTLPQSLQRLWGLEEQPKRGRRPDLDIAQVVEAAIRVADADGLEAVSMSRVAAELGFTTMSLYRHVASKDELLMLMRDFAAGGPPLSIGDSSGWRSRLWDWSLALAAVGREHPWIAQVSISGPPIGPHSVAWMEQALRAMRETDLEYSQKLGVILLLDGFVRSSTAMSQDLARSRKAADQTGFEMEQEWARNLAVVADPQTLPEISNLVNSGTFDVAPSESEAALESEFVFGLECILNGVNVLIQQARDPRRSPTSSGY